jgi:hypothetical protein
MKHLIKANEVVLIDLKKIMINRSVKYKNPQLISTISSSGWNPKFKFLANS